MSDDRQHNGCSGLTRRGFVMSALAMGFALAVRPVWAETIVTDGSGLMAGEVMIPTDDGDIPAYRLLCRLSSDLP
jgi:carboxymethylenebutenolidase